MCLLHLIDCIHNQCKYLSSNTPNRLILLLCVLHSPITTHFTRSDCRAQSAPRVHGWQLTITSRVDFVRCTDCGSRYGISEHITPSSSRGCNTPWLCLDGIVCLQASQVACVQKRCCLLFPCSAWCWQSLKFITPVLHFCML